MTKFQKCESESHSTSTSGGFCENSSLLLEMFANFLRLTKSFGCVSVSEHSDLSGSVYVDHLVFEEQFNGVLRKRLFTGAKKSKHLLSFGGGVKCVLSGSAIRVARQNQFWAASLHFPSKFNLQNATSSICPVSAPNSFRKTSSELVTQTSENSVDFDVDTKTTFTTWLLHLRDKSYFAPFFCVISNII